MTAGTAPSLSQNVAAIDAGAHVTALGWLKGTLALGLGDGAVMLAKGDETQSHRGASRRGTSRRESATGSASSPAAMTAGWPPRTADGTTETLAETKGAWIDSLALNKGGAFAYGAGKRVIVRDEKGREKMLDLPRRRAASPSRRRAIALPSRITTAPPCGFPNTEAKPEFLEWKGSHLDITWSPDARFLVTSMQENALHGWRLVARQGQHAHERLSVEDTLGFLVGRWQVARDLRRGGRHPVALRLEGGPDGQAAARMRRAPREGRPRRLSSRTPSC